jgi:hypothetical protein
VTVTLAKIAAVTAACIVVALVANTNRGRFITLAGMPGPDPRIVGRGHDLQPPRDAYGTASPPAVVASVTFARDEGADARSAPDRMRI